MPRAHQPTRRKKSINNKKMNKVYIISEICGQWGGSVQRAEQMILQSKLAGADAVKVQLYDTYRMPGDDRQKWEYLSMTEEQFLKLKTFADNLNIDFFASAFDEERFSWIRNTNIKINKIGSILLELNLELCKNMISTKMETYCSLGKWKEKQFPFEDENVKYFHCLYKYPHYYKEAVELMPRQFDNKLVGYSDHTLGTEACREAIRRGAKIIEKHYTTDHNLQSETEGAHSCSMNMEELRALRNFCDKPFIYTQ